MNDWTEWQVWTGIMYTQKVELYWGLHVAVLRSTLLTMHLNSCKPLLNLRLLLFTCSRVNCLASQCKVKEKRGTGLVCSKMEV
jgi:hypothetical protein